MWGLDRWDLIEDVLKTGHRYDPEGIVGEALPQILKGPGNVPVFKYLREIGALNKDGSIKKRVNFIAKDCKNGYEDSERIALKFGEQNVRQHQYWQE